MHKDNTESQNSFNNKCFGTIHVVKHGDTLYNISRTYGVKVSSVMLANPYVNVYNLQVGDEICVPRLSFDVESMPGKSGEGTAERRNETIATGAMPMAGGRPVTGNTPMSGNRPVTETTPMPGNRPVTGTTPMPGNRPVTENIPMTGNRPATATTPMPGNRPVTETSPMMENRAITGTTQNTANIALGESVPMSTRGALEEMPINVNYEMRRVHPIYETCDDTGECTINNADDIYKNAMDMTNHEWFNYNCNSVNCSGMNCKIESEEQFACPADTFNTDKFLNRYNHQLMRNQRAGSGHFEAIYDGIRDNPRAPSKSVTFSRRQSIHEVLTETGMTMDDFNAYMEQLVEEV